MSFSLIILTETSLVFKESFRGDIPTMNFYLMYLFVGTVCIDQHHYKSTTVKSNFQLLSPGQESKQHNKTHSMQNRRGKTTELA